MARFYAFHASISCGFMCSRPQKTQLAKQMMHGRSLPARYDRLPTAAGSVASCATGPEKNRVTKQVCVAETMRNCRRRRHGRNVDSCAFDCYGAKRNTGNRRSCTGGSVLAGGFTLKPAIRSVNSSYKPVPNCQPPTTSWSPTETSSSPSCCQSVANETRYAAPKPR